MMSVIYGMRPQGSFAKLNQNGLWVKMSEGYCQVKMDGSLEEYLGTWPKKGIMRGGIVFQPYVAGAHYQRERVAVIACANGDGLQRCIQRSSEIDETYTLKRPPSEAVRAILGLWAGEEPNYGRIRTDDGVRNWMDRIKCLGNCVVLQQFYPIFKAIAEIEVALS